MVVADSCGVNSLQSARLRISSTRLGSTPSKARAKTALADFQTILRIATVMSKPMMGSVRGKPSQMPSGPTSTARLVRPSMRAWWPSAISACGGSGSLGHEFV
jgi:hypothetical protein